MDVRGALEFLSSIRPDAVDLSSEIGDRDRAAFLRVWQPSRPDRWAVVWTPGDRWFSVDVEGGYSLDHFEDDTPDEDVRELLSRYVDVALAYVRGDMMPERTGRFRVPVVKVPIDGGLVELRLSLLKGFRAALTPMR